MLFTSEKLNFKFSASSNFLVIPVRSIVSTSFRNSMSGSRVEDGCDVLFFFAIFRSCLVEVVTNTLKSSCFCNHVY